MKIAEKISKQQADLLSHFCALFVIASIFTNGFWHARWLVVGTNIFLLILKLAWIFAPTIMFLLVLALKYEVYKREEKNKS